LRKLREQGVKAEELRKRFEEKWKALNHWRLGSPALKGR